MSGISDWFLKGTSNRLILREVKGLAPATRVVVTADSLDAAAELYADGADYVLVPSALAAEHLYPVLADPSPDGLARARRIQARDLFRR